MRYNACFAYCWCDMAAGTLGDVITCFYWLLGNGAKARNPRIDTCAWMGVIAL